MTPTHATLAILFVDVSGSTRLYETIGDERALARVGRSLTMIARVSEDCGGRVVKTMGDGAMCVFETADAAMRASRLMLEKNDEQQDPGEPGLGLHVGCHYGPVLESAGDVFGDTVNLAARVAGLAKVGQIITTADTAAKLSPELAARARKLHAMPVKGKQEPVVICELLWQDVGDLTVYGTNPDHARVARLLLRYDGREWRFDGPGELYFGRDGGLRCRRGRQQGIPQARAHRAAAQQVRARRSKLERHVGAVHRGDRGRRTAPRGTDAARERRHLLRARSRRR
jgi:class 3 adenylate cyclase